MRRLLKNLSANSLGVCISLMGQIFTLPLFLHIWNKQLYGEWLVLTTVPNLLMSLEGGLSGIASNRMTLASSVKNWEEVNAIFQTTLLGQFCVSVFIFIATLICVSVTDVKALFGFTDLNPQDAAYIFTCMIAFILGGLLLTLYRAPYRASDLEARGGMLLNFWRITDFIVTVIILLFHKSPVCLATSQLIVVLTWTLLGYTDVTRKCPNVHFGFVHISWQRFREMLVHGLPLIASQAATAFYMQGYPLAVNKVFGSASVVTFTSIRMLCRFGLLAVQTMVFSSAPILSRSYGMKDWPTYYRLLRMIDATALWAGIGGLIGFTTLGPWVLNLWSGGKVHSDHLTFFLFALSISLQGAWICFSVMLASSNRHHEFNYIYSATTLLAVIVAPWLMVRGGFTTVPIIMAVSDGFFLVLAFVLCCKKLTNFNLKEMAPIFTFSFYREGLDYAISRVQSFRNNPGKV